MLSQCNGKSYRKSKRTHAECSVCIYLCQELELFLNALHTDFTTVKLKEMFQAMGTLCFDI